jgi:hypothetical protein
MVKETVDAISEYSDNGIVASVWRCGNNLGMCFSKEGKTVMWNDMDMQERCIAVQNLYAAADFFSGLIMNGKPEGLRVEDLTTLKLTMLKKDCEGGAK